MTQNLQTPQGLYQMVQHYKEAQLLMAAIRLEIFSHLGEFRSPGEVTKETGYNERNLGFFFNALAAIGLLEKGENGYKNTAVSQRFLNRASDVYLGEFLLFRERATSLERVEDRVKKGPDPEIVTRNKGVEVYDFYEWAEVSIPEMYAGRVQSLLTAVSALFQQNQPFRVLDLGGGSGVLCMEIVNAYPGSSGVIFEDASVAELPKRLLAERGQEDAITVLTGDFTTDDVGSGYDLILASGIIDFASDSLTSTVKKLYHALNPSGYLYLVAHDVSDDYLSPKESIVGWLSSHLDGLHILLPKSAIENALAEAGFLPVQQELIGGAMTHLHGNFYQKSSAH